MIQGQETSEELKIEWNALNDLGRGRNKKLKRGWTSAAFFLPNFHFRYTFCCGATNPLCPPITVSDGGGNCRYRKQALMTAANATKGMTHPFLQRKIELQRQARFKDQHNIYSYFWFRSASLFSFRQTALHQNHLCICWVVSLNRIVTKESDVGSCVKIEFQNFNFSYQVFKLQVFKPQVSKNRLLETNLASLLFQSVKCCLHNSLFFGGGLGDWGTLRNLS